MDALQFNAALHAAVSHAINVPVSAEKPLAWRYQLAHARNWRDGKPAEYCSWQWHLTDFEPCVPSDSIRNLTPLYAARAALHDQVTA